MDGSATDPRRDPRVARALVPLLAGTFVVLAVLTDSGTWWRMALLAVPVGLLAAWYRWALPVPLLVLPVIGCVAVAQSGGALELSMFLIALTALVAAGWQRRQAAAVPVVVVCLAVPVTMAKGWPGIDISWLPWSGGVLFAAALGWSIRVQQRLTTELATARDELASRALLDERRRIARDVHDLVGHGLAAVMLQVTSARHVLRRDPDSAEEALAAAEQLGRRSMRDLRSTVGLLRDVGAPADGAPPGAANIPELVTDYRKAGLTVQYQSSGRLERVDGVVGMTLYRIAQEALANAGKHMPHGRTTARLAVAVHGVTLEVLTHGAVASRTGHAAGGHYGLPGMRERADVVGGTFSAGPTPGGWLVRVAVPLPGGTATPRQDEVADR